MWGRSLRPPTPRGVRRSQRTQARASRASERPRVPRLRGRGHTCVQVSTRGAHARGVKGNISSWKSERGPRAECPRARSWGIILNPELLVGGPWSRCCWLFSGKVPSERDRARLGLVRAASWLPAFHSHFRHLIPHFSSRSPCISGSLWRLQPPSHPSRASSLPTLLALSVFSIKISKEPDFWPRGPDHVIALPVPAPGRGGWRAVASGGTEYGHRDCSFQEELWHKTL